jgi:hypothetical protein
MSVRRLISLLFERIRAAQAAASRRGYEAGTRTPGRRLIASAAARCGWSWYSSMTCRRALDGSERPARIDFVNAGGVDAPPESTATARVLGRTAGRCAMASPDTARVPGAAACPVGIGAKEMTTAGLSGAGSRARCETASRGCSAVGLGPGDDRLTRRPRLAWSAGGVVDWHRTARCRGR